MPYPASCQPVLRPRLLAAFISAAITPAFAAAQPAEPSPKEDTITVTAAPEETFRAGGDELVPAYLDGQVANGGRLGLLGEQEAKNVPFNIIGYTSKMIEDQQATTLTDVIRNDATVQAVRGYGNFAESYRIRGFQLDGDDIAFGGLYGVLPRQVVTTNIAERVEIIKGSNAFLNGVPPGGSGVGGSINVEPKRAQSIPLTRVSVDYGSDSQIGTSLDAGRRFGDSDQFGARVNVLHREGDTAVDDEKDRTTLASMGLDYQGERLRGSLDAGWQKSTIHNGRIGIGVGAITEMPDVPDNSDNYSQKWVYSDMTTRFAALRGEYDVANNWTFYGGIGGNNTDERGEYSLPKLLDDDGNASVSRLGTRYIADSFSGMTGIRGKFDTGVIGHSVNLGYSGVYRKTRSAYTLSGSSNTINIYDPTTIDYPPTLYSGGSMDDPHDRSRTRTSGVSVSDTLSALDDRVLLTVGARRQDVTVRNYDYQGVETPATRFDAFKVTPVYGLVVKPWEQVSFYANHIEALQPGPTASSKAVNAGQVVGIVQSKQNEVGMKMDFGRVGGTLALFEIKKPVGMVDEQNVYGLYGEQQSRGMELNVFGEPVYGVRLLGSALWMKPELSKTAGGVNDGNDAVGVPRYAVTLGGEWDLPWIQNLTATGTVTRTGSQYANASNTIKLDGWTGLDLGARYSMKVNEQTLTWRAAVENVTNEKYWASVDDSGTYLTQGDPRMLKLSMSVDF
ncbi:TonB-dependent siderophore receptor [Enterobacteriaceae bacterium H11S18]|uniref:TonB-dependent receptor n=1 Tax=Dryocola clanedunensis TaxID=2925396 RepID=UPI0022F0A1CD|nr:TonB-dependent siderophore receptor [Dryocola clanedunensis]MCT4712821.1 TonB-dependent siderophore receptor [Dryocola clanedunensis]